MCVQKSRVMMVLFLFFSQSVWGVVLISPATIKKFLDYKGKKHMVPYEPNESCDCMLWNYAEYKHCPWSMEKKWQELITSDQQMFGKAYVQISSLITTAFDVIAEENKKMLEQVSLSQLDERELQALVHKVLCVRETGWRVGTEKVYPQKVVDHFEQESKKEAISKKYTGITNGYELIKLLGFAVASYFDPDCMGNRVGQDLQFRQKSEYADETFEQEPDYFILLEKNAQDNTVNITSLPGYRQDMLYKNDMRLELFYYNIMPFLQEKELRTCKLLGKTYKKIAEDSIDKRKKRELFAQEIISFLKKHEADIVHTSNKFWQLLTCKVVPFLNKKYLLRCKCLHKNRDEYLKFLIQEFKRIAENVINETKTEEVLVCDIVTFLRKHEDDILENPLHKAIEEANWLKQKDKSAFSYKWKLLLCTVPSLIRFAAMAQGMYEKYEGIKKRMGYMDKVCEETSQKLAQMECPTRDELYWNRSLRKKGQNEKIKKCYEIYEKVAPKKK